MDIVSFKAWFEGFAEGVADAPTPEQWAKIKAKVATIGPTYTGIRGGLDPFKRGPWIDNYRAEMNMGRLEARVVTSDAEDYPADHPEHASNIDKEAGKFGTEAAR